MSIASLYFDTSSDAVALYQQQPINYNIQSEVFHTIGNNADGSTGTMEQDARLWGFLTHPTMVGISFQQTTPIVGPLGTWMGEVNSTFRMPSIREPYGYGSNPPQFNPNEHEHESSPIVWILLGIGLVIFFALIYLCSRRGYWRKLRTKIWPEWKRRLRNKIIEMLTKGDEEFEDPRYQDIRGDGHQNKAEEQEDNKIEDYAHSGGDKILVTPDMSDFDQGSTVSAPAKRVIDADTGYMQGVRLHYHPRPAVVTSLSEETSQRLLSEDSSPRITASGRSFSSSTLTIPSTSQPHHTTGRFHPPSLHNDSDRSLLSDRHATASGARAGSSLTVFAFGEEDEKHMPSYYPPVDLSTLQAPSSLPVLFKPSAPLLDLRVPNSGPIEPAEHHRNIEDGDSYHNRASALEDVT